MSFLRASQRQRSIVSRIVEYIIDLFGGFQENRLTEPAWDTLLHLAYPEVESARRDAAELARDFYDEERLEWVGETADTYLAEYRYEWFAEAMEPAKRAFLEENAPDNALSQVALRVAKEVENGWRRTLIRAVQEDPINQDDDDDDDVEIIDHGEDDIDVEEDEMITRPDRPSLRPVPSKVRWARVATGAETCGFCMMLVSRGPVYQSARSAGLNASNAEAHQLIESGDQDSLDALMSKWHPGCDCRVVPVFDENDWVGRDAYLHAESVWKEVTRGLSGNEALNAFRRAIESGEYDLSGFSVAA